MLPQPRNRAHGNKPPLPKRRCDNCGKLYQPTRELRPGIDKYGFCSPEHKKQFHKHGAAFIQMRDAMQKEIDKRLDLMEGQLLERLGGRRCYLVFDEATERIGE